jgi:hypothetical protein
MGDHPAPGMTLGAAGKDGIKEAAVMTGIALAWRGGIDKGTLNEEVDVDIRISGSKAGAGATMGEVDMHRLQLVKIRVEPIRTKTFNGIARSMSQDQMMDTATGTTPLAEGQTLVVASVETPLRHLARTAAITADLVVDGSRIAPLKHGVTAP